MRWEIKAFALAVLSVAPFGSRLYRRLQDLLGTSRLDLDADYGYASKPALIRDLRRHGVDLTTSDILEIGTGWHGVLPLLLSLAGARSITTIDMNPWLTSASLDEALSGSTASPAASRPTSASPRTRRGRRSPGCATSSEAARPCTTSCAAPESPIAHR
jgi:hypothetical protein